MLQQKRSLHLLCSECNHETEFTKMRSPNFLLGPLLTPGNVTGVERGWHFPLEQAFRRAVWSYHAATPARSAHTQSPALLSTRTNSNLQGDRCCLEASWKHVLSLCCRTAVCWYSSHYTSRAELLPMLTLYIGLNLLNAHSTIQDKSNFYSYLLHWACHPYPGHTTLNSLNTTLPKPNLSPSTPQNQIR